MPDVLSTAKKDLAQRVTSELMAGQFCRDEVQEVLLALGLDEKVNVFESIEAGDAQSIHEIANAITSRLESTPYESEVETAVLLHERLLENRRFGLAITLSAIRMTKLAERVTTERVLNHEIINALVLRFRSAIPRIPAST